MKIPKFSDTHRFPNGSYTDSRHTDVSKTIAREKERLKSMSKVIPIRKANG